MLRSKAHEDGLALIQQRRYEEASECFRQCVESEPDNGPAWNDMGAALFCLGGVKQAVGCLERARDLLGPSAKLYWNLAQGYLADGRPGEAAALFEDMKRLGVLNADIVGRCADSFIRCDNRPNATEVVLDSMRLLPDSEDLRVRLESIRAGRAKVAFFCGRDGATFLKDILAFTEQRFQICLFDGTTYEQMYKLMKWSDISWFEWCTDMAVEASKLPKVCKNIVRLHRYEAYLDYPKAINWDNIDMLITVGNRCINEVLFGKVPDIAGRTNMVEIANGVNLAKFEFIERRSGRHIAFVGDLRLVKNPMFAIQCMQRLHKIDAEYKLFFAGRMPDEDGFVEQYLKHMVDLLGLSDVVFFDGWQEDMNSWLADKQHIVSTSVIESQGMGVLEGMACGLKPVIHNFPGAEQIFAPEFLFNTAEDFCERVLSDEYEPRRYRSFVEQRYSLQSQLERINEILIGFESKLDVAGRESLNCSGAVATV